MSFHVTPRGTLLTEWTQGESLRKHALAVEAAVCGYARTFGEDEQAWGVVALLHDFDYERYQTAADHPFRGCEELQRRGYPDWVTRANPLTCRLQWRCARNPAREDTLCLR